MVMILHRGGPFKYPRRRSARSGSTLSLRGARASMAGRGGVWDFATGEKEVPL